MIIFDPGPGSMSSLNSSKCDIDWIKKISMCIKQQPMISPFDIKRFAECLIHHPNQILVQSTINGMKYGNSIGYIGNGVGNTLVRNFVLNKYKQEVNDKIYEEVQAGRYMGPYDKPPLPNMFYSPLKAIPKDKNKPDGEIRLLLNLSYPYGEGINQYEESKSLMYETLDCICESIYKLGNATTNGIAPLMYKFDVKSAYRNILVRSNDHCLLGFTWLGKYFYDTRCSFGGKHSTYLWEEMGQLIQWIMVHYFHIGDKHGNTIKRWVDDFIGISSHDTAHSDFNKVKQICKYLNIPIHKVEPPSHKVVHLGIGLDSKTQTLFMSDNKRTATILLLNKWLNKKCCTKQQLQSLIGKLFHCSLMIKPGRAFLGRLLALLRANYYLLPHHHIKIPSIIYLDIEWWIRFVPAWSGTSVMMRLDWTTDSCKSQVITTMYVDACSTGRGCLFDKKWFAALWSAPILNMAGRETTISMPFLECYVLAEAIATYGPRFLPRQLLLVRSDCQSVCYAVNKGYSRDKHMMMLVRSILYTCALYDIQLRVQHIVGKNNTHADMLSRMNIQEFLRIMQPAHIDPFPTPIAVPLHLQME
jgi:hypothetical protein